MLPNLLNMAISVLGKQQFSWQRFLSKYTNDVGLDIPTYATAIILEGQVQAVPRELFEKYGLNFQKKYLIFYVSKNVMDVDRDVAGDLLQFGNNTYECLTETSWFQINGWTAIIAAQIT
jgi:hypothetical protein